ncbi:MAG: hypothetical protein H0X72_02545 [Acidobacteria bacterium]|jgi:WD40 repeat protein|nr:hypothetical protein [Acidobacteriota bacterium]
MYFNQIKTFLFLSLYILVLCFSACVDNERLQEQRWKAEYDAKNREKKAREEKALKLTLKGHNAPVKQVTFTPDGTNIISSAGSKALGEINIWDVQTGSLRSSYKLNKSFDKIAFSPDGKTCALIVGNNIELFEIGTNQSPRIIKLTPPLHAVSLSFSPDGSLIAAAVTKYPNTSDGAPYRYDDFSVQIWDTQSGNKKANTSSAKWGGFVVDFSPDGKVIGTNSDKNVILWESTDAKMTSILKGRELTGLNPNGQSIPPLNTALKFLPDNRSVIVGDYQGGLRKYDISSGKSEYISNESLSSPGTIQTISTSSDGKWFASDSRDEIQIFQITSGNAKIIFTLKSEISTDFYSLCLSPDGKYIAAGLDDKTIKVWETAALQNKE